MFLYVRLGELSKEIRSLKKDQVDSSLPYQSRNRSRATVRRNSKHTPL